MILGKPNRLRTNKRGLEGSTLKHGREDPDHLFLYEDSQLEQMMLPCTGFAVLKSPAVAQPLSHT